MVILGALAAAVIPKLVNSMSTDPEADERSSNTASHPSVQQIGDGNTVQINNQQPAVEPSNYRQAAYGQPTYGMPVTFGMPGPPSLESTHRGR